MNLEKRSFILGQLLLVVVFCLSNIIERLVGRNSFAPISETGFKDSARTLPITHTADDGLLPTSETNWKEDRNELNDTSTSTQPLNVSADSSKQKADTNPSAAITSVQARDSPISNSHPLSKKKCNPSSSLPKVGRPNVAMTDLDQKLLLTGVPKGGATVSAQTMLRYLNLTETALAFHPWIHNYRIKVFHKDPKHRPLGCRKIDCQRNWLCIKIVRSVVDRAVSSYIHTVSHAPKGVEFPVLETMTKNRGVRPNQASFQMFLKALSKRSSMGPGGGMNPHYMPQADLQCDSARGIHLVPLEGLQESFDIIKQTQGVYFNTSGLTSQHYFSKPTTSNTTNMNLKVSSLPLQSLHDKRKFKYVYDDMFDTEEVKTLFCNLYCHDIALYARMC